MELIMGRVPDNIPLDKIPANYRFERKFVYQAQELDDLINSKVLNNAFFFREVFERRTINNIYFDDANRSFYKMNVSGVGYRSKYRLRWYGDSFKEIVKPVLEIKKKFGEAGEKLLHPLPQLSLDISSKPADEVYHLIKAEIKDEKLLSVMDRLFPVLYNSYERRYFLSADEKFRITLDYNMKFYNPNVDQYMITEAGIEHLVLELKYPIEHDFEGRKLSQFFDERLSKNSKYVLGCDLLY